MTHTSDKKSSGRFDRTGIVIFFLLCVGLSLLLVACNSSSPTSSPDARLNQHLAYGDQLDKDATLKPHQTVVLNLSSLDDDHLSATPGSRYHNLPYEISNAGKYKYCIPDNDTHLTQVELFDPAGALVGNWKKGEPCTYVPLAPGKFSMHVHLDTTDSDPPIFMKPNDVKVMQTGTMKTARKSVSSYVGPIPQNQFLNLKVDSLTDVLPRNKAQGLTQGWGVSTPDSDGVQYHEINQNKYAYVTPLDALYLHPVLQLMGKNLLYFNQEQGGMVSIQQGDKQVALFSKVCVSVSWDHQCSQWTKAIGLDYVSSSSPSESLFNFSPSGTGFKLSDSNSQTINWINSGDNNDYYNKPPWLWESGAGGSPVNFNVKVRYGTTSGLTYPAMLANEVVLFDSSWTPSGFPANTHYWIINADKKDFTDFAFDNPDQRIKTVIAGRGARAQLFQNPSFQGDSVYVSPPVDGEMLMTGTDNDLLNNGTIGSIGIEPNSNTIPINEYEYHVIVSGNTCIGCDLRGFDASSAGGKTSSGDRYLSGVDFSDSDLSYANLSIGKGAGGTISGNSKFRNVNFTGANFTKDAFIYCDFTRADFTNAILTNVRFTNIAFPPSETEFYTACPKFEYTDLTTITGFDSYFRVDAWALYNADNWWNTQRKLCRTSIAYSKVSQTLFTDKRLWQFVDAPGVDFSNMNLDGAVFAGSNLRKAIFKNASLKGTVFVKADLTGADLSGADLTGAHLEGATLTGVDLHKAKTMSKAFLSGISLNAPNLSGLDMSGAQLKSGVYTNWDGHTFELFPAASINGAYMYNTKLNGADLSYSFLNGVSWFGADASGENATMIGTHFEHADLPGLNLKKTHLQGANFTDAQMVNANLSTLNSLDYSFKGTTFYQANLRGANLSGANLNQATLDSALIYADASQQYTYIEVMDDPTTNPGHYRFYQQNYTATIAPSSTDNITTCPNGTYSPELNCGDLGSDYWGLPTNPPKPPTDCTERAPLPGETPSDDGMVLVCTSHRHPK